MNTDNTTLPADTDSLQELITSQQDDFKNQRSNYEARIELLQEEVALLRSKLFGPQSEKYVEHSEDQLRLFETPSCEENEAEELEEEDVDDVEVNSHKRKKRGRKPLPQNLRRIEIIHELSPEELACACGSQKTCSGREVSEELVIIPAELVVEDHVRLKYACKNCEGTAEEGLPAVIIAPKPKQMIPKSFATPSLLAQVFTSKFVDSVPYYRQEKQFSRLGIELSRQSMSNWTMKVAPQLETLLELMQDHIHSGPILHLDETPFQVLKEPGRKATSKSYMWVMYGGPPGSKGVLYKYSPSRSGDVARELLGDYSGCVQTDDYCAYGFLNSQEGIVHLTCMAHIRRKFMDIKKSLDGSSKKKFKKTFNNIDKILRLIRKLYMKERYFNDGGLTGTELLDARGKESKPLFDKLQEMVNELLPLAPPKGTFGKALSYASKNLPLVEHYLHQAAAGLDNNPAENQIRPFAIGRKNWLFSGNVDGAKACAAIYSLVLTAKLNRLEPFNYLEYIFKRLPSIESEEEYKKLLPFNLKSSDLIGL